MRIEELSSTTNDARPTPFHFDLAPTAWTSELLHEAREGRAEMPWVSWHPDRASVMAVVGDGTVTLAARLASHEDRLDVLEIATALDHGVDLKLESIPRLLESARNLAERFLALTRQIEVDLAPWRKSARGAGARRPDTAYAALAARYVQLVNSGERHPAKALGAALGMSPVTVSQRIRECRNAPLGLLTEATHGAAGGMLTDKAKHILARVEEV